MSDDSNLEDTYDPTTDPHADVVDWRATAAELQTEVTRLRREVDRLNTRDGVLVATTEDTIRLYRQGVAFDRDAQGYCEVSDGAGQTIALFPPDTWTCAEFVYTTPPMPGSES